MADLADSYESNTVGDVDETNIVLVSGAGRVVHGIHAFRRNGRVVGLRLKVAPIAAGAAQTTWQAPLSLKPSSHEVDAAHGPQAISPSKDDWKLRIYDGGAGERSLNLTHHLQSSQLVGFVFGFTTHDGRAVICGYRTITTRENEFVANTSNWKGRPGSRQVQVRAKPGYAVSAARLYGLDAVDGMRLTFSRIVADGLDIQDGYDAEPVGFVDVKRFAQLTGRGKRVNGFSVAMEDGRLWGFGLHYVEPKSE
jgi:hypothetical protein